MSEKIPYQDISHHIDEIKEGIEIMLEEKLNGEGKMNFESQQAFSDFVRREVFNGHDQLEYAKVREEEKHIGDEIALEQCQIPVVVSINGQPKKINVNYFIEITTHSIYFNSIEAI